MGVGWLGACEYLLLWLHLIHLVLAATCDLEDHMWHVGRVLSRGGVARQETAMFSPPCIGSQLARQRHHDMQAQVGKQRLLHQLRKHARASRRAGQGDHVGWISKILAQSKMRGRTGVRHVHISD